MEDNITELHWQMGMLHSINVGLVVIDMNFCIQVWNKFMENRSGIRASQAVNQSILEMCQEIPEEWFLNKVNSVATLGNQSFTIWEQNPYLFKFKNFRPITGAVEYMYQNTTFIPLSSPNGEIDHVGIIVYDVTDMAVSKLELEATNAELQKLSRTDRLTQLNNRGYWEECLSNEFQRAKRTTQPVSLIIFDIDHFKKVNDSYGHMAGDEVIRQTSRILRESIRETDIPGRYGGEEFVVLLIDTQPSDAFILAERLRTKIEDLSVNYEGQEIKFTISLGISAATSEQDGHLKWLEYADSALYLSKESGRNQTSIHHTKNAA
ncbi:MAG: diguanylate cyclase [Thiohalomonadales bacterium]